MYSFNQYARKMFTITINSGITCILESWKADIILFHVSHFHFQSNEHQRILLFENYIQKIPKTDQEINLILPDVHRSFCHYTLIAINFDIRWLHIKTICSSRREIKKERDDILPLLFTTFHHDGRHIIVRMLYENET